MALCLPVSDLPSLCGSITFVYSFFLHQLILELRNKISSFIPSDLKCELFSFFLSEIAHTHIHTREMKTHVYTKNMYMNVHGNIIHNSQKIEQAKCSTEQNVVYPYIRILLSRKN